MGKKLEMGVDGKYHPWSHRSGMHGMFKCGEAAGLFGRLRIIYWTVCLEFQVQILVLTLLFVT